MRVAVILEMLRLVDGGVYPEAIGFVRAWKHAYDHEHKVEQW